MGGRTPGSSSIVAEFARCSSKDETGTVCEGLVDDDPGVRLVVAGTPAAHSHPTTMSHGRFRRNPSLWEAPMPTILVVDDDSNTCSNMTDLFSDLGYSVESAQEAESALAKARSRNYDVGLVDLRMPGMDGLTLCRHLKQLHPRMVTMIVTAYIGEDLCREAAAIGVRDVVTKP